MVPFTTKVAPFYNSQWRCQYQQEIDATIAASWLAINRHEWSYLPQSEAPNSGVLAPFLAVQRGNIDNNHGAILYKSSTFYNSHWRCHKQQEIDAPFRA
jgi:hypothetical protein